MKKLALALAVATLSLSTAAFAADGEPATPVTTSGQIKFEGMIIESGCTLDLGNSATINLGTMSKTNIQKKPSGWARGQIKFLDCNLDVPEDNEPLEGVKLTIVPGFAVDFGEDAKLGGLENLTSDILWANDGNAKNVGVQVEISANKDENLPGISIEPKGLATPIEAKITNDAAIFEVRGRMVGATDGVTAGSVLTTITFNAEYF